MIRPEPFTLRYELTLTEDDVDHLIDVLNEAGLWIVPTSTVAAAEDSITTEDDLYASNEDVCKALGVAGATWLS